MEFTTIWELIVIAGLILLSILESRLKHGYGICVGFIVPLIAGAALFSYTDSLLPGLVALTAYELVAVIWLNAQIEQREQRQEKEKAVCLQDEEKQQQSNIRNSRNLQRAKERVRLKELENGRRRKAYDEQCNVKNERGGFGIEASIADMVGSCGPRATEVTHVPKALEDDDCRCTLSSNAPTGLDAVAGMTELKQQLRDEVVEVFRNPARFKKYGISIPNGVLLFGPPGCGKTYIARQLAAELGYSFFEIAPSDIGSSYMHGTILKIRETFEEAARKAPSVLFIDEFEALVPSRATMGDSHQYKAEEVNEFLTQMSSCSERRILLIAATNQPWEIDQAVQRSGRVDKKIYVAPPDLNARSEMLTHHLRGRYMSPDLTVKAVANQLFGYSSSDLKLLVDEAAKLAFKADEAIGEKHLAAAMGIVSPSVSDEDEERYQRFGTRGNGGNSRAVSKLGFHAEEGTRRKG
jgi:AAA+ superfamily predicted ATPase